MEKVLAESLVEKRIIGVDTEIEVAKKVTTFGNHPQHKQDHYIITEVNRDKDGDLFFRIDSAYNGESFKTYPRAIIKIDGMSPEQFARAYQLDAWGNSVSAGKKRGRKTKQELIALMIDKLLQEETISRGQTVFRIDVECDDDRNATEDVFLESVVFDEDPPCLEVRQKDGETFLIEPTQVITIDGHPTIDLLTNYRDYRRLTREAYQKDANGRDHQHNGVAACQDEIATQSDTGGERAIAA